MKILFYIAISFLTIFTMHSSAQNQLKIHITNLELIEGEVMLRLTSNPEAFDNSSLENELLARKDVKAHEMDIVFTNLKDGTYAFALFQDLNENEKLDRKKFGIPAEPFAFSKNALGSFGPPKFDEASFEISGGGAHTQDVKMIYHKPKRNDDEK